MIETRLILVDGLTGSGKSTTAQRLWLHLQRLGYDAQWCSEDDAGHPLWRFDEQSAVVEAGALDPGFLDHTLMQRWRDFVAGYEGTRKVMVFESALTMAGFLRGMNVAQQTIVEHVLSVNRLIAGLRPVLVYLRHRDVARALREVCDDRRWGGYDHCGALLAFLARTPYGRTRAVRDFDGLVRFYEDWQDLLDQLFDTVDLAKLVVDRSASDWASRERQVTDFLGLPAMARAAAGIERPARFCGIYRDPGSADELVILGDRQGLCLGGERPTPLVAKQDNVFLVKAMSVELHFVDECDGCYQRVEAHGNQPGLSAVWVRRGPAAAAHGGEA